MTTINTHQAKTHLSSLLERVSRGEEFVIAKAGKPVARLMPLAEQAAPEVKIIGFMAGHGTLPAHFDLEAFDALAADEIALMYDRPL